MNYTAALHSCLSLCKYPLLRLNRSRVARGFSVHSPFAYYFITRVLRERLPFYCFGREITLKDDKLLFRLINHFQPATVCILGTTRAEHARKIIDMARRGITLTPSPADADFVYACADAGTLPLLCRTLYAPRAPKNERRKLLANTTQGMTFANSHALIAVTRPGLPRQHFSLSF